MPTTCWGATPTDAPPLHTTEHIIAVFPDFDQNRGMIRDLTRVYDGHGTHTEILSVTDESGEPRDFDTEKNGDYLSVTVAVPKGEFVHGEQHYVIEYSQRDVTRFFEDNAADEFYWDVNGTEWRQPFGQISATLTVDDELVASLNGDASCYRGAMGSTQQCGVIRDGNSFSVDEQDFRPGENVTLAVGFDPDTFAAAPRPFQERVPLFGLIGLAGLLTSVGVYLASTRRAAKLNTTRTVLPRYDPPEMLGIAVAGELLGASKQAATVTLLDFAVRGKIELRYDATRHIYGVRSISSEGLLPSEQPMFHKLFGHRKAGPGDEHIVWFTAKSTKLGDAASANDQRALEEVKTEGLLERAPIGLIVLTVIGSGVGVLLSIIQLVMLLDTIDSGVLAAVGMLLSLVVGFPLVVLLPILLGIGLNRPHRPTPKGGKLIDHLAGLRAYMQLSDADRIRMMQSPSGPVIDDHGAVDVYERLLPYAVLFGIEEEWQQVLTPFYRDSSPTWFYGNFRPDDDRWIRRLDTTIASSRTTSSRSRSHSSGSSSSSRGGSSGGGFSGGGGGGGGGRGI